MCGIAGIAAAAGEPPPSARQLEAMGRSLAHRGPDQTSSRVQGQVGFSARRLAIIDLEGANQPLENEDGSVWAIYNGEIYNYRELRQQLERRGHRFRSQGDGEVIVHLWEEYGTDFVERLNGMFALALHDARSSRLVLARDRIGIKPLFYHRTRAHVVFASEPKALLASGLIRAALNLDAVPQFLAWEYVPAPDTLFEGIFKLEPAELIEFDLDSMRGSRRRYWAPGRLEGEAGAEAEEWTQRVESALGSAARRQTVADVPLGVFLSGGVDSSLLLAQLEGARAFTFGFEDPSYGELRWAEMVARHLRTALVSQVGSPDLVGLFHEIMPYLDDPIADSSVFPTFLLSRLARREVKVALSGDGADELFGGYDTYAADQLWHGWRRIPPVLRERLLEPWLESLRPRRAKKGLLNSARRFAVGARATAALGHARWRLFLGERLQRTLLTQEARQAAPTPIESHILRLSQEASALGVDRAAYVDLKSYLSDNCLVKLDRMSMANSLEARVPYLDPDVVDTAFALPTHLKVRGPRTKILLKRIAARRVPARAVYRTKQGFSSPLRHWLRGPLRPLMRELLCERRVVEGGLFVPATVRRLMAEHEAGIADHAHVLWAMIVFHDWRSRWKA